MAAPVRGSLVQVIAEWTAVKLNWNLAVDAGEKIALTNTAQGCPNSPLPHLADPS
ncbi:hypothetical protein [Microbispora sp. NBRC 16548]|uniref:hypothetical protein n=1 Tax=Microbispora sp. NBRC 16548 TaxID=3030994 RepID=UPI0024A084E0|nr:hypothetical protein [Microbispora sp. NBRC 16548]GLX11747.1 hypothetical protein Misp03_86730 [Microbispora sp. NBRC 16548]